MKGSYIFMKTAVDNIIFYSSGTNIRAGGPQGYLANLQLGIGRQDNIIFITQDSLNNQKFDFRNTIAYLLTCLIPVKKYRRSLRQHLTALLFGYNKYLKDGIDPRYFPFIRELNKYSFKTITCHVIEDAIFLKSYLKHNNGGKLLQMSHCPQPPSEEVYNTAKENNDPNAENTLKEWQKLEKEAFSDADIYIFPSKESVDCYTSSLPYFQSFINEKDIRYVRTGCQPLENLRTKYNIETPFIISYIGRHNQIKGYDLLKEIAEKILAQREDVTFLIGGAAGSIPPLQHPRWIEIGRCNPAEVLSITDAFILPNRQTYFDLILLEVMSTGTPVFASRGGGNTTVEQDTHAITLYDNIDDCVNKLNEFLKQPAEEKSLLRQKIKAAYQQNYTLEVFAQNYINMIKQVVNS